MPNNCSSCEVELTPRDIIHQNSPHQFNSLIFKSNKKSTSIDYVVVVAEIFISSEEGYCKKCLNEMLDNIEEESNLTLWRVKTR